MAPELNSENFITIWRTNCEGRYSESESSEEDWDARATGWLSWS